MSSHRYRPRSDVSVLNAPSHKERIQRSEGPRRVFYVSPRHVIRPFRPRVMRGLDAAASGLQLPDIPSGASQLDATINFLLKHINSEFSKMNAGTTSTLPGQTVSLLDMLVSLDSQSTAASSSFAHTFASQRQGDTPFFEEARLTSISSRDIVCPGNVLMVPASIFANSLLVCF